MFNKNLWSCFSCSWFKIILGSLLQIGPRCRWGVGEAEARYQLASSAESSFGHEWDSQAGYRGPIGRSLGAFQDRCPGIKYHVVYGIGKKKTFIQIICFIEMYLHFPWPLISAKGTYLYKCTGSC